MKINVIKRENRYIVVVVGAVFFDFKNDQQDECTPSMTIPTKVKIKTLFHCL